MDEDVPGIHVAVVSNPCVESLQAGPQLQEHLPCGAPCAEEGGAINVEIGGLPHIVGKRCHKLFVLELSVVEPNNQWSTISQRHGHTAEECIGSSFAKLPELMIQVARYAHFWFRVLCQLLHGVNLEAGSLDCGIRQDSQALATPHLLDSNLLRSAHAARGVNPGVGALAQGPAHHELAPPDICHRSFQQRSRNYSADGW
mmetsp:Transcript_77984/g.215666  ORF Transcript_77984/g.215666 Transcript_77984/m.215666 type:complete len:200 (+) Transcript_77984:440-1039(+)